MPQPIRRQALWFLAAAFLVPFFALCLATLDVLITRRRGLVPEGLGLPFGILLVIGVSGLFWGGALILYVTSWFKEPGPFVVRNGIEVLLFCLWLYGSWSLLRYVQLL
jgi:hypothetical protein